MSEHGPHGYQLQDSIRRKVASTLLHHRPTIADAIAKTGEMMWGMRHEVRRRKRSNGIKEVTKRETRQETKYETNQEVKHEAKRKTK